VAFNPSRDAFSDEAQRSVFVAELGKVSDIVNVRFSVDSEVPRPIMSRLDQNGEDTGSSQTKLSDGKVAVPTRLTKSHDTVSPPRKSLIDTLRVHSQGTPAVAEPSRCRVGMAPGNDDGQVAISIREHNFVDVVLSA
jgi:hypothetical protein